MDEKRSRRVMATPLGRTPVAASPRRSSRRPALAGRVVLAVAGVMGVLFSTVPAQAAPATSAEAAELVAARGHELEVVTEQFNEARETLTAQQAAAEDAATQAQATYDKVAAQQADLQKQVAGYQAVYDRLSAQERQAVVDAHGDRASRSADREQPAASGPVVANSEAAQVAVDVAMAQRGKPYVRAASGPDSFDCSGLTAFAYKAAGLGLPHSSAQPSR